MRKNYPNISISDFDQPLTATSILHVFKKTYLSLLFFLFTTTVFAQTATQCNSDTPIPFINSIFGNLSATGNVNGICILCAATNATNLIDSNLNNFATAHTTIGAGGSTSFRVTDTNDVYAAGTYAGYRIDTGGLLNINLLGSITIRTYLNNSLQETASGSSLLSAGLLNSSGNNYVVGFNTTQNFDAIEISVGSLVGLVNTISVYYPVIRNYCAGPPLTSSCNTVTALNLPTYPVSLEPSHTGLSGVLNLGTIYDAENIISSSTTDYATIALTAGIAGSAHLSVKDQLTDYPANTYAGFEIENSNLLNVSALGNISITTYLNGVLQQQFSGNNLLANGTLLNSTGRYKLGFVSTTSFDEIQISLNQTVSLSLGSTKVYNAVFENFCAGSDLVCNTQTTMVAPTYPVYINGENTGIDGLVCALCSVNDTENIIDLDTTNFAQINLAVGIGNSASISVKDQITDYPIGSFAGFTIENPSLLNVNALDAITIRTYLNGVLQETKFGNSALTAVGTNLLVGSSPQTIGFITTKSFDEVRLTIANTVTISLGIVNVYQAIFQKLCPVTLECNKTYTLTNPTFPVIIDSEKTGVDGVTCVACAVNNTNNVLTASTTDFASILVTTGVIAPASIAVLDQLSTYPQGTFAGFTIKDLNSLLQVDLFNSLTISTYLDGVLRESKSASQLLNLSLTIPPFGSDPGMYNVGFLSTLSFDEIRISVGSLASVINDINVYGAFINTANTSGGTLHCAVIDAIDDVLPSIIGATGSINAGNVLTNDTINGNPIAISDVDLAIITAATPTTIGAPVPSIDPATGIVSVPTSTPAGNYTITYQICYKLNSLICDTATVIIGVSAAIIVAENDFNTIAIYGITGGTTDIDIFTNDALNETPVNTSDIVFSSTPNGPLTVNSDGTVTVEPNTPGGTYTVDYTICEKLNPTNCSTATVSVFVSSPSIALIKGGAIDGTGLVGETITYTFTVVNTGNLTLTNIEINDVLTGSTNLAVTPGTLAPNATGTATATYTILQSDIDNGNVTNTATVTAKDPNNNDITDISGTTLTTDNPTITNLTPSPGIALVKTGLVSGSVTAGNIINYTFTVTNTGNTMLSNVFVNDALTDSLNLAVSPSTLAPNASGIATATYTIKQSDIDIGSITNTATVIASLPISGTISDISGTTITNDDPTETILTQSPDIVLVKTGAVSGTGTVGDIITYTFAVTNTGNTTLTNVVINDTLTGSVNLAVTPNILAPNTSGIATATYTITQSDIDAGETTNSATVTATLPISGTITDISGTTMFNDTPTITTLTQNSGIALVKTGAISGTGAVGDIITYTFAITNTGNTTLTNVVVNDLLTGSVNLTVTPNILAPNTAGIATATYTITQSDIDAGKVTNSATVTATLPITGTITDISGTTIFNDTPTVTTLTQNPAIVLVKTGVIGISETVGDLITYTFAITNTGNTTLTNVVVNDPMINGGSNLVVTPSTLTPNATGIATATYTIKQSDIDAGEVTNSATVTATLPITGTITDISGTTMFNDTPTITTLTQNPDIALVKTGAISGTGAVGDIITYTFTIINTGNTTLKNISVSDPLTGSVNLAVTPDTLESNEMGTATAIYTIQQSDIDAGEVTNSATVTATLPITGTITDISGTTISNDTPTIITLIQNPDIVLVKTGAVSGTGTVGDIITYTFSITNTGNTTLTNVVVNDPMINGGSDLVVTPSTLAPNTAGIATATYTIQQSDIDAGEVTNSAIVTATLPITGTITDISGTTIFNDTPTITTLTQNPDIALVKTGAVSGTGAVGDIITYTFSITNTGNTTLTNVMVNDPMTGSVNLAVTPSTLAPNTAGIATATYTIKQSDIDAGDVTNSATVTATLPITGTITDISGTTISNDTPTVTTLTQNPGIALVKTGAVSGTGTVGDIITYTFSITNTGNTKLTNVVVNDPMINGGSDLVVTPSTLAPNEIGTATATYTIQQSDIDAGEVTNSAIVTATLPITGTITDISGTTISNDTPTVTTLTQNPGIALIKTGAISGTGVVGDIITYTFTIINTGNTTLKSIVVNDPLTGSVNLAVTPDTLESNEMGTATAIYTIQQSDIDAGEVTNSATVTATLPISGTITDISGTTMFNDTPTIITLIQNPDIVLVKTGAINGTGVVGDIITYTFSITNTGNTTLTNIVVNDPMTGSVNLAVTPSTLTPNATGIATATYTIQQSDIDAGEVTNSAIVTATLPITGTITDISGTTISNDTPTVTTLTQNPDIALVKTGAISGTGTVGDIITYTFSITNTGNTTLTNVVVNDPLTGSVNLAVTPSTLAPNEIGTATATYTIQQSDIDAGEVTNSATVTATLPITGTITDISGTTISNDTPTVTTLTQNSDIKLVKTGVLNGKVITGNTITYTFTVTNTGNTTLTNVVVNDPLTESINLPVTPSTLAPNETGTATATYTITQSDIDAEKVTNIAIATGTKPISGTVSDLSGLTIFDDTPTINILEPNPHIALVKSGTISGTGIVGDVITYTFTVTNTGINTLSNIIINDPLTGSVNLAVTPDTLAPDEIGIATATYIIKQSDIDAGKVTNSATVTATLPISGTVTDISGTTIDNDTPTETILTQNSGIALVKTGALSGTGIVGDMITYTFTVTNTGNTTLSNTIINDPLTGSVNLAVNPGTLAPNEIGIATATYTITQSDIDAGKVTNSATVTATLPITGTISDISGTTINNDTPTETSLSSIALTKEGIYVDLNNDGVANEGDVINYTFTVTNTGNTVLTNITVTDNNVTVSGGPLDTLAIGASDSTTFTAVYIITTADIESGYVYNLATVTAISPENKQFIAISTDPTPCETCPVDPDCLSCTITPVPQSPSIALIKTAVFNDYNHDGMPQAGETITYSFNIVNTGNTSLTNVWISDTLQGIVLSGGPISLAIGESDNTTFIGVYTLTENDIITGKVTNQATAYGTSTSGQIVTDLSDNDSLLENDVTIIELEPCVITVYNAVSPDGDGLNDFFRITGIECYPKNTVEIYNRWGVKVFEKQGYVNEANLGFDGKSGGRATINESDGLPSGTYFYIIKYVNSDSKSLEKSGYLMLTKD
ncbi:MAG: gliding motility-associated C-terminal domain-containing protein [Flavobacterium sp.]